MIWTYEPTDDPDRWAIKRFGHTQLYALNESIAEVACARMELCDDGDRGNTLKIVKG